MEKWGFDRAALRLLLSREMTTINHWLSDRPAPDDVKALLSSYDTLLEAVEAVRTKHPHLFEVYLAALEQ